MEKTKILASYLRIISIGAREMARQLKEVEDLGSMSSAHMAAHDHL